MLLWEIAGVQPKVDCQAGVERIDSPFWGECLNPLSPPEILTSASGGRASLPLAVC